MMRLSFWLRLGAFLVVVGAAGALYLLYSFNQFRPVREAFAGTCTPVAGVNGPEDLQIDPKTRLAFISSFDRAAREEARGGIFAFSIDDFLADDAWRDRTAGAPEAFEPLGLHFYRDADVARLFVVNAAGKTVELYDVADDGDLTHLETFAERRLTSPNDVVAVGPRAFYVSNDVEPGRNSALGKLQFLFRSGSGRVFYFDGVAWRVAAEGLRFANGVSVSNDGARIYVAETAGAALRIYDREKISGVLKLKRVVPMGAAVDNINVDAGGSLWIGAHPKPLMAVDPGAMAPSLVIRFDESQGKDAKPEAVYADDGDEISASTAAALLGETLLIGALNEKKFLLCNLPA